MTRVDTNTRGHCNYYYFKYILRYNRQSQVRPSRHIQISDSEHEQEGIFISERNATLCADQLESHLETRWYECQIWSQCIGIGVRAIYKDVFAEIWVWVHWKVDLCWVLLWNSICVFGPAQIVDTVQTQLQFPPK